MSARLRWRWAAARLGRSGRSRQSYNHQSEPLVSRIEPHADERRRRRCAWMPSIATLNPGTTRSQHPPSSRCKLLTSCRASSSEMHMHMHLPRSSRAAVGRRDQPVKCIVECEQSWIDIKSFGQTDVLCNAFQDLSHYLSSCQSCLATTDVTTLTTYNSTYLTPYLNYCKIPEVRAMNSTSNVGSAVQTLSLGSALPSSTSVSVVPSPTPATELEDGKSGLWKIIIPAIIFILIGASVAFYLWRRWSQRKAGKDAGKDQSAEDAHKSMKPLELEVPVRIVYEMEGDSAVELSGKSFEVHEMEANESHHEGKNEKTHR